QREPHGDEEQQHDQAAELRNEDRDCRATLRGTESIGAVTFESRLRFGPAQTFKWIARERLRHVLSRQRMPRRDGLRLARLPVRRRIGLWDKGSSTHPSTIGERRIGVGRKTLPTASRVPP